MQSNTNSDPWPGPWFGKDASSGEPGSSYSNEDLGNDEAAMAAAADLLAIPEACRGFQLDLSCLVDGELTERSAGGPAASRAIAHLEDCSRCSQFFEDVRLQMRLHKDMADPARLNEQFANLVGGDPSTGGWAAGSEFDGDSIVNCANFGEGVEARRLVHKLASIFYELGKAYVLSAIDPDFRTKVFEPAVKVASTRARGRGFIDGVVDSGRGESGGVDWGAKRHMLNGQLSRIEGALEKGSRLLAEALEVEPDHEEARIYLAYVDLHEGRRLRAARAFEDIFDTAMMECNRGHAAVQLAKLHAGEADYRRALRYLRWITMSGLADREERFFVVRFNIGCYYAYDGQRERSLAAFRKLLDTRSDRVADVAACFEQAPVLCEIIGADPAFAEGLLQTCPELFEGADSLGLGVAETEPPEGAAGTFGGTDQ